MPACRDVARNSTNLGLVHSPPRTSPQTALPAITTRPYLNEKKLLKNIANQTCADHVRLVGACKALAVGDGGDLSAAALAFPPRQQRRSAVLASKRHHFVHEVVFYQPTL